MSPFAIPQVRILVVLEEAFQGPNSALNGTYPGWIIAFPAGWKDALFLQTGLKSLQPVRDVIVIRQRFMSDVTFPPQLCWTVMPLCLLGLEPLLALGKMRPSSAPDLLVIPVLILYYVPCPLLYH